MDYYVHIAEVELADQTYQTAASPEDGPNFYLTKESPQEHDTDQGAILF